MSQGLSSATTNLAVNGARANPTLLASSSSAATAATPIAAPSYGITADVPPPPSSSSSSSGVPMSLRHEMGARPRLTYSVNAEIKGYGSLAQEDRQPVSELMFWAMSIKCTDGNYASKSYARPRFWRVETLASSDYLLILGGWDDLDFEELEKIKKWDPQPEGMRNIIGIRMITAPENDPPHNHYMSIAIRYRREEERRRRISTSGDYPDASDTPRMEVRSQMGGASKKRSLVSDVVHWIAHGSSSAGND